MTRIVLLGAIACSTLACREPDVFRIGDGIARERGRANFDSVVQQAFDALPGGRRLAVAQWDEPVGMDIVRAMEGADAFARMPGLIGVVGHGGSRDALLAASVYNAAGIPQLVPTGTSRKLSTVGPWTFPLVPNDSVEGAFLANFALDSLHAARVGVFYVGDEYGIGLRDGVRSALRARRRDVVDETMLPNRGCGGGLLRQIQEYPATAALRRARPDVVILAVGSSSASCLVEIAVHEMPNIWILGADGVVIEGDAMRSLPAFARARVRGVSFWVPGTDAANRAFIDRYRRVLNQEPSPGDALGYDGMMLLAAAVRDGSVTRAQVRRWIESLGRARPPYQGVTGPISFDHGRVGARLRMISPPEPAK